MAEVVQCDDGAHVTANDAISMMRSC